MRFLKSIVVVASWWCATAVDLLVTSKLAQKPNVDFETHVGGVVFLLTRTSALPNIFGRPDIFGRKIDRGSA
jgi:hypothetical protein